MNLRNTTKVPNHVLRRMVGWCCRQLDLPVRDVKEARFRNREDGFASGCAQPLGRWFVVSCGRKAAKDWRAQFDEVVRVTAHELAHILLGRVGSKTRVSRRYGTVSSGGSEQQTRWHERMVMQAYEADRLRLLEEWAEEPARPAAPATPVQKRAAVVAAALVKWNRKLALAKTKVRAYKKKVAYYQKKGLLIT